MSAREDEAHPVDLNSATPEELATVGGLGPERVRRLVEARPLESWAQVRGLAGFGGEAVSALQSDGASLGDTT